MPATASQIKRRAKLLFRWCVVNQKLEESRVRAVIGQVLKSRRRGYIALLSEFKRLVELDQARHTAKVDSAVPLPPDIQTRIQDSLEGVYKERLLTHFSHDPDLIGGIRIQVSSDVYDGSVRSRLVALAKCFGIQAA